MGKGSVLINLSGRGDKDMDYIIEKLGFAETAIIRPLTSDSEAALNEVTEYKSLDV